MSPVASHAGLTPSGTVVFFVQNFFQERDYDRFGIELLQRQGYDVRIWEIFYETQVHYASTYRPPDPCRRIAVKAVRRLADLRSELQTLGKDVVVIACVTDVFGYRKVFRTLAHANVQWGIIFSAYPPFGTGTELRRWRRLLQRLTANWKTWRERIYLRSAARWWGQRPANYVILSGGQWLESTRHRLVGETTRRIWTHALDYDQYLGVRNGADSASGPIVFLDQYVPFHPDDQMRGLPQATPPEKYYPKLVRLFQDLEAAIGSEVVIAAHPRANYADHPDYFCGRKIIRGSSPSLIRDARLVVSHDSTAGYMAVLFRKPLLFVTTNDLKAHPSSGSAPAVWARELGRPCLNLDEAWSVNAQLLSVDEDRYRRFQNQFIKREGTAEKESWSIVAEQLKLGGCE